MNTLTLGQWSAVATIVAEHCLNPGLVAAVDAELEQARREAPQPEPEKENPDAHS